MEKARRTGRAETERAELARVVRAAATVAGSEAEFVRLLRDAGLAARPRFDRVAGIGAEKSLWRALCAFCQQN